MTKSRQQAFQDTILEIAAIAELCVARRVHVPALVLVYSGIDTMSWLTSENPASRVQARFTSWVDTYMLAEKALPCTSLELYSARCGILHTLSAESDLAAAGRARRIFYVWGNPALADNTELTSAIRVPFVFVSIEALLEAFRLGVAKTVEAATSDLDLSNRILTRSGQFFTQRPAADPDEDKPPSGAA